MSDTITDRVRRGALLLDTHAVGWAFQINEQELNLGACNKCILGQVYGQFEGGVESLCGHAPMDPSGAGDKAWRFAAEHGFFFDEEEFPGIGERTYYAALAAAWLSEIRARLEPADDDPELATVGVGGCPTHVDDVP
jgi:hypothetical protein